ncbi:predicted protein [Thalassiosira pseudonana CCMP1335]|uniref:Uncharacterized protein n=1 Tax=Thalassiosira pseudonana TaxID=35128 RepID=B8C9X3_THAPS|nr:predicted protein [Thalassiosira pseudonana CCMP1335]EED89405.1 predicted protein [Thalassiosira pseudonana CCMP1335]
MTAPNQQQRARLSLSTIRLSLLLLTSFLFGLAICSAFFTYHYAHEHLSSALDDAPLSTLKGRGGGIGGGVHGVSSVRGAASVVSSNYELASSSSSSSSSSLLAGLRILATIASYDFMQLPHLEEVLDGFQDLCYAGSMVDLVIYTTVVVRFVRCVDLLCWSESLIVQVIGLQFPEVSFNFYSFMLIYFIRHRHHLLRQYPVALIDMLNDRMRCNNPSPTSGMTVTLQLKPPSVRLHLVDFHRTLFYDRIDQYDLFIYTEDDIRVSPKTVASYLYETRRVQKLLEGTKDKDPSDYNVGIVRYEYNFPENVVITDKTRHATENVTRVYWEHLGKPIFEKAVDKVDDEVLSQYYISMHLHHQGMYLATRELLKAWKVRPNCKFDEVRNRPGKGSQPSEGTQRVWMSSQMLYGGRHCGVKQLLPVENFGQLTVLHLPNKNYRRVGKQGRLGGSDNAPKNEFSDGTEVFQQSSPDLLRALELHVEMKRQFPDLKTSNVGGERYVGVRMVDTDIDLRGYAKNHREAAERRLEAYREYVARGGYMVEEDLAIDIDSWRILS